jgi:RNA polymerase-binding transcription factor DksA
MHTLSDEKLRNIRAGLLAREAELRERLRRVREDPGSRVTTLPRAAPDATLETGNDEILQIERALERVEAGTYDLCERCGGRIGSERLRLVPYAAHCHRCAKET